jgi:hypothetical protein
MKRRRRLTHTLSFGERLAREAKACRDLAEKLVPSPERDALLKKAQQADAACQIDQWLSSPGLQPPRELDIKRLKPRAGGPRVGRPCLDRSGDGPSRQ